MKMTKALLFVFGVISFSCKKDPPIPPGVSVNEMTAAVLTLGAGADADFFGRIVDESGMAVEGATVTVGNLSATTDDNGVFRILQTSVKEEMAYVRVEKPGYFLASRSLIPSNTAHNYVQITLVERELTASFPTGGEHAVIVAPGVKVEFQGQFVDEAGNQYYGGVKTFLKYIPPNGVSSANQMPGSALGQGKLGGKTFFETYGIVMMEIEGNSGQHINIARGSYATLRLRLSPEQLFSAQPSIPLAFFDNEVGYWIEQGAANLVEDEYIGEVTNIATWNAAVTYEASIGEGMLVNYYGDSLVNFPIQVNSINGGHIVYSNSDGYYSAYLPADINLTYNVIDPCGDLIEITTSPPFVGGSNNIHTVQIQLGMVDLIQEQGTLVDCSGTKVTDGYILIELDGLTYIQYVTNGVFEVDNVNCNAVASYEARGHDFVTSAASFPNLQAISLPITSIGDLMVCMSHVEYLSYTIDAGPEIEYFTDIYCARLDTGGGWFFKIHPADGSIKIVGSDFSSGPYSYFSNLQPGTIWIRPSDMDPLQNFNYGINLVNFGGVGDYVSILFTGSYTDNSMATHTIDGDLAVIRDF